MFDTSQSYDIRLYCFPATLFGVVGCCLGGSITLFEKGNSSNILKCRLLTNLDSWQIWQIWILAKSDKSAFLRPQIIPKGQVVTIQESPPHGSNNSFNAFSFLPLNNPLIGSCKTATLACSLTVPAARLGFQPAVIFAFSQIYPWNWIGCSCKLQATMPFFYRFPKIHISITHVLGPVQFIWWIQAKYKPSTIIIL